jgi:hypothetical protein
MKVLSQNRNDVTMMTEDNMKSSLIEPQPNVENTLGLM